MNLQAYLHGVYVFLALQTVLANAFSKGRTISYPDKPLEIFAEQKHDKEKEMKKLLKWFEQMKRKGDNLVRRNNK